MNVVRDLTLVFYSPGEVKAQRRPLCCREQLSEAGVSASDEPESADWSRL